ncbi:GDP-mannose-dependent alpha-(1-6)-phosphatidylinositol monomannoside mannosyltransferase [Vibrio aerogenes CECT 7868]|uniref:GDP-mannose-dependent alpha-(1-6)-phosphatidylinositol monomannoside mannosyltransferase n=1 Tax=Vibrio aerogenes CECT 7868 TaxID=1216006 RepID=A0A1M5ZAN7_9VIBR|nr:glycosyltransferase [Vibrio aerogenes]SHI21287.1 GDP-mannose-dependent alpha-(1-6)-phosphatidylinositol monomannoside mannosyltransferase [Vibrio aerogenes CECT 7868]
MKKKHHILFVHYGDNWIRGSERCLLEHLAHLDKNSFRPFIWTNSEALHTEVKRMGLHSELSEFPLLFGWRKPRIDLLAWFRLVKQGMQMIRSNQINMIHLNSAAPCQWMNFSARMMNIPLLTQIHTDYPARDRLTLGLHFSPKIIAVSSAVTRSLIRDGYPQSRLSVIHNGIDTERLSEYAAVDIHEYLDLPEDAFVFLTVGSLIKRKGIDRILSALRHVALEYPQTHLVVIGDGPLRKNLELIADELHLTEQVHFVGEKDNAMGWMRGADAFISGARNEPFGLVITEAALAELPIIAPETGGIPEIISHKKHGLLYKNTGVKPMVDMMRLLLKNPAAARKLAQNANAHIRKNYTIEHNTQAIESHYRKALAARYIPSLSWFAACRPIKTYVSKRLFQGG